MSGLSKKIQPIGKLDVKVRRPRSLAARLNPDTIEYILSGSATDAALQQRDEYMRGVSKVLDWSHRDCRASDYCAAVGDALADALVSAEGC